jgi:hypothetical protein
MISPFLSKTWKKLKKKLKMSFGLRLPSPVIKGPSMSGLSTGFRIRRHTEAQLFRDGSLVSKDKVRLGKVRSGLG